MTKKFIKLLLIIITIFSIAFIKTNLKAYAADAPEINAQAAILIDVNTGKILYEKNIDEKLHPASMTKMMTEYLLLEAIKNSKLSWDQKIAIDDYTYKVSQNRSLSNVPLRKDIQYTVKELYESMAIYSANGSTIALAEAIAGSEANFVKLMNQKAKELGLVDCTFVNSTGLNNADLFGMHPAGGSTDENIMPARAVAALAYRLLKDYPQVLETASIPTKIFKEGTSDQIKMENWNWMLPSLVMGYTGIDGLKTGSTDLGGYSFTATAKKGDIRFISVIMKASESKTVKDQRLTRFIETKKLLDYGFSNFSNKELFPQGYKIPEQTFINVLKGKQKTVEIETKAPLTTIIKNDEESMYEPTYIFDKEAPMKDNSIIAPFEQGQKIGYFTYSYKGSLNYGYILPECSEKVELITSASVKKASWIVLLFRQISSFFQGFFK